MVRYRHRRPDDADLRNRLKDLVSEHRRFGYCRLNQMLKREGTVVNLKKVRRLYAEERLQVKRRKGRKKASGTRAPLVIPQAPDQRWSLDFVSDVLAFGRRFRVTAVHGIPKSIRVDQGPEFVSKDLDLWASKSAPSASTKTGSCLWPTPRYNVKRSDTSTTTYDRTALSATKPR